MPNPRTQPLANSSPSDAPTASRTDESAPGADGRIPADERIRVRAYELYLGRGGEHGGELGDWLRAEREFHAQRSHTPADGGSAPEPLAD